MKLILAICVIVALPIKEPLLQGDPFGRGNCLRRAFTVGLAYMGRNEDAQWIPDKASMTDVRRAAERYGLTLIEGAGELHLDNPEAPVLIVYVTESEEIQHAVFASDSNPFRRWHVTATVIGWDGNHRYTIVRPRESMPIE